jgi:predicted transcriptional regulator
MNKIWIIRQITPDSAICLLSASLNHTRTASVAEKISDEQQFAQADISPENARAGVTLSKYRNQMGWRRNKVKDLLARGYHQHEIANTLHISQPTISRDIHYIQKEMRKSAENYGEHLFEVYRNNLLGLDEMIKKLWTIVDSPKTDSKEKIKAITLIGQCYKERFELVRFEPSLIQQTGIWIASSGRHSSHSTPFDSATNRYDCKS